MLQDKALLPYSSPNKKPNLYIKKKKYMHKKQTGHFPDTCFLVIATPTVSNLFN